MQEIPKVIEDLALGAFRLVKEKLQIDLDFTAETLPLLDHYLLNLAGEDGRLDEKIVGVVGPCAGAYFGEVARRTLPELQWQLPDDTESYADWRIEGVRAPLSFNPIGVALEAIHGEALAEWNAHLSLPAAERAAVDQALAQAGGVREDDFFRLAVRHEVLEQALAVLART